MKDKRMENKQGRVTTDDEMEFVEMTLSAQAVAFYKKQARLNEVDDWKFHLECFVNAWAEEQEER